MVPRIRTPSLPSVPGTPSITMFENDEQKRYFAVFQDQTAFQLTPLFDSNSFRILILQACDVPSIRHVVIAIGALGRSCIVDHDQRRTNLGQITEDSKAHHRKAIKEYSTALGLMREASTDGRQGLRTTLITCLLIVCFECFHGNYTLAESQIESGLALIENWRKSYTTASQHPPGFSSPAPEVIDHLLIQIFGSLELQGRSFGDRRPPSEHQALMYEGEEAIQRMPRRFDDLDNARTYLELITRRLLHWDHALKSTYIPKSQHRAHIEPIQYPEVYSANGLLNQEAAGNLMHTSASTASLITEHARYRHELDQWNDSFGSLLQASPFFDGGLSASLLRLGSKACRLLVNKYIADGQLVPGEEVDNMIEIINLSPTVAELLKARSNVQFTILQGAIDPSKILELSSQIGGGRREMIDSLLRWPRHEGVSNSLFMGVVIERSQTRETDGVDSRNVSRGSRSRHDKANLSDDMEEAEQSLQNLLNPGEYSTKERRNTII